MGSPPLNAMSAGCSLWRTLVAAGLSSFVKEGCGREAGSNAYWWMFDASHMQAVLVAIGRAVYGNARPSRNIIGMPPICVVQSATDASHSLFIYCYPAGLFQS